MNEEIKNFSLAHAEPDWLAERRQAAEEKLADLKFPYFERVRYDRWDLTSFALAESPEDSSGNVPDFTALSAEALLVEQGSRTVFEQIPAELTEKGVVFTDFAQGLAAVPEIVEKYLNALVQWDENLLTAVNAARFNSGVIVYVPDNVEVEVPLEAILQTDETAFAKHVLIVAGKNSKVNYLERLQTLNQDKAIIGSHVVEVFAEAGAQVKYSAIDELGKNVTSFISRRSRIADSASVDWSIGIMNDGNVICDFDSELRGRGSHSNIKAVGISAGHQIQGVNTRVTNYGKDSIGHINQSGVILDHGTLTFNGIGHIINGASGADAQQKSRVMMLSDTARGDANPILLIDENDVKAGHAASVGQLDPEDMYYLQSRGLDEETAKRLVIRGFLGAVVTEIPIKSVRDEFVATIDKKLAMD